MLLQKIKMKMAAPFEQLKGRVIPAPSQPNQQPAFIPAFSI
jgi:hypothetical protein